MNILICEDEHYWSNALKEAISKWAVEKKVEIYCAEFSSPQQVIHHLKMHTDVDVLFLDISLGEEVIDGMSLAKRLRKTGNTIPIIFVTIDSFRAADGYLVEAMGFLSKPMDGNRLSLFLDRILKRQKQRKMIQIMSNGHMISMYQSDIVYVEIIDHIVTYHTTQDTFQSRSTLSTVLMGLDQDSFIQIHRSYLVFMDRIESIKTTYPYSVTLIKNDEVIELPVSRKYITDLLEAYSDDMWEKLI